VALAIRALKLEGPMKFAAGILGALTATLAIVAGAGCSSASGGTDARVANDVAPEAPPGVTPAR
jgi:hypothetical protein